MKEILSVILGGGAGTRLFPLTHRRAKPAVPLAGRYRLIDIPISNCINSGINRIFVLTQFNSASLNQHIQKAYRFDRFDNGFVSILAAEQTPDSQDWFQGTADAVRRVLTHIHGYRHSHVLILSGDQLYSMDYRKMFDHHCAHEADITIATIPVEATQASAFGILKTDADSVITEFHEKPDAEVLAGLESPVSDAMQADGRVYLASMGIYLFHKNVLAELLDKDHSMYDFGGEIIPSAIKSHRVVSYPFEGYWSDIGTIRSFFEANIMLAQPQPPYTVYDPAMPLYTSVRTLPHAKLVNAVVRNSIIAEASIVVDCEIEESVIGIRSFVGPGTRIKRTVMMGADYFPWQDASLREPSQGPDSPGVNEGAYVENAIIDRNVSVGKRCKIFNQEGITEGEGPNFYIRDGIVILPKNAVIPDDTVI